MSNELTKKPSVPALLETQKEKKRFKDMLGSRATSFMSSIVSAVNQNPQLRDAEPNSVLASAAIAASLDLPINPSIGFSHIVPYKTSNGFVGQFQMGWKGFVQLAMRTGQYKTMNAAPVLEGQIKSHNLITGEMEFNNEAISNKILGYVLYFKLLNGFEKHFYMTRQACEDHGKKYSAAYKRGFGPWVENFDAMALKTVVKLGLSKYGMLSVAMQTAIEFDQAAVSEDNQPRYVDQLEPSAVIETTAKRSVDAINEKIKTKTDEIKNVDEKKDPTAHF